MPTIGILLPGSTLYPSIGIDFLQGIKSCFGFHQYESVDIQVAIIGYGVKEDEIYQEAQKFLLINNADAVVVFAGDHHANKLAPLFAAADKLLLITNAGANYPLSSTGLSHTIFHSLNDCVCSFLTGKICALQEEGGNESIMATSYFDGGYQHTHAMLNAFILSGGQINYNFSSHFKKEEFNTDALTEFIKNNPGTRKLMAVFCGDLARFFYEKMGPLQNEYNLHWYGSPMMFDCTPGDFAEPKPYVKKITGYTAWVPELSNESNGDFKTFYQKEKGKEANLFSIQGWEVGLLLMEYFQQRKGTIITESAIAQLTGKTLNSPRGTISLNETRMVLGTVHLVHTTNNLENTVEDSITDLSGVFEEMLMQIPEEKFSTWQNTYLCI